MIEQKCQRLMPIDLSEQTASIVSQLAAIFMVLSLTSALQYLFRIFILINL